jgi:cytochrome oxidase Cu insertion factor (SCO1/SenC/PrrC family)
MKTHEVSLFKSEINAIFYMLRLGLIVNSVILSVTLKSNYLNGCNCICYCVRRQKYRHLTSTNIDQKVAEVLLAFTHCLGYCTLSLSTLILP